MALSLESISSAASLAAPRILLLGVQKVGKSTMGSESDHPIFIPVKGETGLDYINTPRFPVAPDFAAVMDALRVLYQDEHVFRTPVIDSISALEPLIWDAACKEAGVDSIEKIGGGYGKWKSETLQYWRELTNALDYLRDDRGMGSILIGHVKAKEFNDPETDPYTTYTFDVADNAAALLYRWADVVLFANFKRALVVKSDKGFNKKVSRGTGDGQRVLLTQRRPAHPGGGRGVYGHLPYELQLGWQPFIDAVKTASNGKEATTQNPQNV